MVLLLSKVMSCYLDIGCWLDGLKNIIFVLFIFVNYIDYFVYSDLKLI